MGLHCEEDFITREASVFFIQKAEYPAGEKKLRVTLILQRDEMFKSQAKRVLQTQMGFVLLTTARKERVSPVSSDTASCFC